MMIVSFIVVNVLCILSRYMQEAAAQQAKQQQALQRQ